ncbi:hypothetical protein QOZ80_1BG0088030 [Eleusine coracana subsp. coracana]|nr:hypothetical protein QOZ80_1BG0088030 [Eleusine coracana subsp. coracana]
MQAQSRFSAVSGSSSLGAGDEQHEAVIRELTRGHELTAQLRAEAMRALRGHGQAEDTAAFILQEVSRAFTVCLSIMSSSPAAARAPPPPETVPEPAGRRHHRDENVPRREIVTYNPDNSDGYQWRKYGQKKITNTRFPRCYYKCSYHRDRGCPATKQVQRRSHGDNSPQYVVIYINEHTCDTAAWEPEAAAAASPPSATTGSMNPVLDLPGLMARLQGGVQEEHERQVLVSSLATVLGAHSPAGSSSGSVAFIGQQEPAAVPPAPASAVDPTGGELPRVDADAELDVMDYDVADALYFGNSYGLPDDGLPF